MINIAHISEKTRNELRKSYGYNEKQFILLYVAEFIPRKNHTFFIKCIPTIKNKIPNVKIILSGKGKLLEKIQRLATRYHVDDVIWFSGYRNDIYRLCQIADVYVAVSKQEGLPVSVIEALSSGLPIVASDIRGQRDIVVPNRNGFLFSLKDAVEFIAEIELLYRYPDLRYQISRNNTSDAVKYSVNIAVEKMATIYKLFI